MRYTSLFKSPSVSVAATSCRPGHRGRGAAEAQSYHSLAFVRRGAYKLHQGDGAVIVEPMSAVFWAANDEYSVSHPFGCDDCIEFRFDDESFREARPFPPAAEKSRQGGARIRILPIGYAASWRFNMTVERVEAGLASPLEIDEAALAILRDVASIERAIDGDETNRRGPANHTRAQKTVERTKELLLSDLARNWSLKEIAKDVGASPFHLTRLFGRYAGTTLHQYLTRQRLVVALDRVLQGADDLTALALDLGFSSHSHFSAAFRSGYGCSPKSARTPPAT